MAEQAWFSDNGKRYATELEALQADHEHWRLQLYRLTVQLSPAETCRVNIIGFQAACEAAKPLIEAIEKERRNRPDPTHTMYDQHP